MSTKIHAACALSSARQIPLCRPFLSGPKPPRHERQPVCSVAAGDLYGPCRQLQMSRSQKKHKLLDFFFLPFFKPQTRSPKFPQQIKSKLLKGWFTPALISLLPPPPPPPPDVLLCLKEIQQRGNALKMSITRATWRSAGVWGSDEDRVGDRGGRGFSDLLWSGPHFKLCNCLQLNEEFGATSSSPMGDRNAANVFWPLAKYSASRKRKKMGGGGFQKECVTHCNNIQRAGLQSSKQAFSLENTPWHTVTATVPSMMCNLYLFRVLMKGCMNNLT